MEVGTEEAMERLAWRRGLASRWWLAWRRCSLRARPSPPLLPWRLLSGLLSLLSSPLPGDLDLLRPAPDLPLSPLASPTSLAPLASSPPLLVSGAAGIA